MAGQHFLAVEPDRLPAELMMRGERYYGDLDSTGRLERVTRMYREYYSHDDSFGGSRSVAIQTAGDQGEVSLLKINLLRSFLRHIHILTTGTRPSFQSYALREDYASRKSIEVSDKLIENDLAEGLEEMFWRGVEVEQLFGEAFFFQQWNPDKGEIYSYRQAMQLDAEGKETGLVVDVPIYDGRVEDRILTPIDIVRDARREHGEDSWFLVREPQNRWDMVALFPEHRETILGAQAPQSSSLSTFAHKIAYGGTSGGESDDVIVWRLFAARSPALPLGREAIIVGDKVIKDGRLSYDTLPISSLASHREILGCLGHTDTWDLLAPQEAVDATASSMFTNIDQNGLPNWWSKLGSGLDVNAMQSCRLWESNEPPQLLNQFELPSGQFQFLELMLRFFSELTGINETVRGNAEAGESGAHAALLHSMSLQFNGKLQRAYGQWIEKVLNARIKIYQRFASVPRLLRMLGRGSAAGVQEFSSKSLDRVLGVTVEMGSPLYRTMAGRKELAQTFLDKGWVQTPEQFFDVATHGKLSPITKYATSQYDLVAKENESMMDGTLPVIDLSHHHAIHIECHSTLLTDPFVLENPSLYQTIVTHIQGHELAWQQAAMQYPGILQATRQQPPPPSMMSGAPPGPGAGPQPGAGNPLPGGGGGASAPEPMIPGADQNPVAASLPKLPENPATHEPPQLVS